MGATSTYTQSDELEHARGRQERGRKRRLYHLSDSFIQSTDDSTLSAPCSHAAEKAQAETLSETYVRPVPIYHPTQQQVGQAGQ
jgi:hypothetical protein